LPGELVRKVPPAWRAIGLYIEPESKRNERLTRKAIRKEYRTRVAAPAKRQLPQGPRTPGSEKPRAVPRGKDAERKPRTGRNRRDRIRFVSKVRAWIEQPPRRPRN